MIEQIDFRALVDEVGQEYFNTVISTVNDHVVRVSVMVEPYPWHRHPNSDETFIGVEGTVVIETEKETFELTPGRTVTIPRDVVHRTRPKDGRSVNLTVERIDLDTVWGAA